MKGTLMFIGSKCPYCNKIFTEADDIVVCPECGTPHHRSCYSEHHACANLNRHGSFEWTPVFSARDMADPVFTSEQKPADSVPQAVVCPTCGLSNQYGEKYCRRCGYPLPSFRNQNRVETFSQPIIIQQISLDEKVDGIPIRDWLIYLGSTGVANIRTFLKQNSKNGSPFGFSIGALFFPFLYYLYYKVWGVSAAVFVIDLLMNMPAILLQANIPLASILGVSPTMLGTVSNVLSYAYLVIIAILSLFSKTIVRRSAAKKIKGFRRACTNEEEYLGLLKSKACPNKVLMSVLLVIYGLSLLYLLFT